MSRERLSELREQVDHEALSALGGYGVDGKRLILASREAIALAEDMTADRDRLAAELARVRRNHIRRMAEATRERGWKLQIEMVSRGRMEAALHKRIIAEMSRFAERCRAALAQPQDGTTEGRA